MSIRSSRVAVAAALFFLLAATACVPEAQLPADCDAAAVQRQATLAGDRLDPPSIDVCRGQQVALDVAAEQDGDLHLHGYDEEAPETEAHAGSTVHFAFTAVRSGQFIIELHMPDGAEVEVGILTVHEP